MKKLTDYVDVPLRLDNALLADLQAIARLAGVNLGDTICVLLAVQMLRMDPKLEKKTAPKGRVKRRKKKG